MSPRLLLSLLACSKTSPAFVTSLVSSRPFVYLVLSSIAMSEIDAMDTGGIELRTLGENESDTARLTGAEGLMSASFVLILSSPFSFFLVSSRLTSSCLV